MKNIKLHSKKLFFCIFLISLAVVWRLINHRYGFAPNLELVTSASILAAIIIGYKAAIIVPLLSMIISDLFIGNSSIYIFTWGSFVIIGLLALLLRKLDSRPKKQIFATFGFAIASSFLFFIITNFGVWLQGWYPATWTGLATCFTLAIPFYRTMLVGNMILAPTSVAIWRLIKYRQSAKTSVINTLVR